MIEKYRPLFIHLNPASIPEVVAHMQKYLTENTFVTVEEFGAQFQEYIDDHPDIIKVGSVNGLTGDVVLTSENITMTGESSDTIGAVIDDLVVDMDAVKSDIATLENVFTGATEESSGVKGLVPAPANTQTSFYLKATGDFEAIPAREVISNSVSEGGTVEQALTYFKTNEISSTITEQRVTLDRPTLAPFAPNTIADIQLPSDGEIYLLTIYVVITRSTGAVETRTILTAEKGYYDNDLSALILKCSHTYATKTKRIPLLLYMENVNNISQIFVTYDYLKLK